MGGAVPYPQAAPACELCRSRGAPPGAPHKSREVDGAVLLREGAVPYPQAEPACKLRREEQAVVGDRTRGPAPYLPLGKGGGVLLP